MNDSRNVIDKYKGWMEDLIKEDLKKKTFPYAVMMMQIVGDFNFGSVVRSANAFGAEKVFYYGKKRWDRRSALGTQNYTDVLYLETLEHLKELKKEYLFIGLEQVESSVKLKDFTWPDKKCMILLGEEGQGLEKEILNLCDHVVEIELFGSVRSLNVGTAGAIAMHDFITKFK